MGADRTRWLRTSICSVGQQRRRGAEPPGFRRLRAGALLIAAGLALAAGQTSPRPLGPAA